MHHGPVADAKTRTCCAGVSAMPRCFLGTGGSLRVTGLVVNSPHLSARAKALETRPAMCLTVFALSGTSLLCLSVMPAALQKPVPFATEMQWRNFTQSHGQQLGREIGCQFPVAFDGLGSEFLFRMLAKELSEQHRERGRKRSGNRLLLLLAEFCSVS